MKTLASNNITPSFKALPPLTEEELKVRVKLVLRSYGVKTNAGKATRGGYTSVPVSDLFIDCRCIKERGISGAGRSVAFQAAVVQTSSSQLDLIYKLILEAIKKIPERRVEKKDPFGEPFDITFCCAWGMHRSVATKYIMAKQLKQAGYSVVILSEPELEGYLGLFE